MNLSKTFLIAFSEMGLSTNLVLLSCLFGSFFLFSFVLSSKNMDAKGVMQWMLEKSDDWVGNKK